MKVKKYRSIFKESSEKELFSKAVDMFKSNLKDAELDDKKISKMKTNVEVQKYNRKFNSSNFEMNVSGLFRKLKTMTDILPKSFISKMIKMYNNRDSKSILSGSAYVQEVQMMIDITEQIVNKIK